MKKMDEEDAGGGRRKMRPRQLLTLSLSLLLLNAVTFVAANEVLESCAIQGSSSGAVAASNAAGSLGSFDHGAYRLTPMASEAVEGGASSGTSDALVCQIRTLHNELDFGNLTESVSVEQSGVTKLKIQCNDVLFFESQLEPGQLRGFSTLQELTISKCKLKYLGSESLRGVTNLKSLSVETFNSEWAGRTLEVGGDLLDGVEQLRELNLGFNQIWSLPSGMLCQGNFLEKLNLTRNAFSDVDDLGLPEQKSLGLKFPGAAKAAAASNVLVSSGAQGCLSELKSIDLSHNSLRTLRNGGFERLRRLTELRLDHNLVEEVEQDALVGLGQLKSLNLSSNKVVALPPAMFKSAISLRELDLRNNSLTALSAELLSPLEHLQVLDISMNALNNISGQTLSKLVRLVILNLAHNQLTTVGPDTFKDLYTLQVLDLSFNSIGMIEAGSFMTLSNLHSLNLRKNKLKTISASMFDGLYVLHKLNLDYNNVIAMEPGALKNCTSLQDLGLVGNQLEQVPTSALSSLRRLQTLDLGENKIKTLTNGSFKGLGQLYGLRLVDNQIEDIQKGVCEPITELRVLNAAQNKIKSLGPNSFVGCDLLRVLRLDSNSLETLPTTLHTQLPNLLWLNVSQNELRRIDYFALPPKLEWLDVSHNNIDYLAGSRHFPSSSPLRTSGVSHHHHLTRLHLRVIDASYNSLAALDHHVIPPSLEILKLNHNKLKTIMPDALSKGNHLRRVELVGNQLEKIDLNALRLPKVDSFINKPPAEFLLGGNPFSCDCDMEWLTRINHLSKLGTHPSVLDLDAIMCRRPYSRSGGVVPLAEMKPADFLCPYKSHCFALCHCCDFDACDCAMTCPFNCTCYHDATWSANVVDCSRSMQNGVPERLPMDSTEVYLDGNNVPMLKSHTFIGRKNLKVLYLNNSVMSTISNKSFNGLQNLLTLHLEQNRLSALHGFEFDHLGWLRELFLQNNRIKTISNATFLPLKSLEILRLDGNLLAVYSVWQLSLNPYLVEVGLGQNPWDCDCQYLHQLHSWVGDNSKKILDVNEMRCTWNSSQTVGPYVTEYNETCGAGAAFWGAPWGSLGVEGIVAVAAGTIVLLLIIIVTAVLVRCCEPIRLWLFTTCGFKCRNWCSSLKRRNSTKDVAASAGDKMYDAYLIYSQKDEEFVNVKLAEELETNENYRLCLHHRDLVNESGDLQGMMWSAVEISRTLVIVLSENFIHGEFSSGEGYSALTGLLNKLVTKYNNNSSGKKSLLFIETEKGLGAGVAASNLLNKAGRGRVLLEWCDDKKFWSRLKFYLPEPPSSSRYNSNIRSNTTSCASGTSADSATTVVSKYDGADRFRGNYPAFDTTNSNKPSWYGTNLMPPPPKYPQPSSPRDGPPQQVQPTTPGKNSTDAADDMTNLVMMMMMMNGNAANASSCSSHVSSVASTSTYHPGSRGEPSLQRKKDQRTLPREPPHPSSAAVDTSYLSIDGEHVYSSLDPPSPQHAQGQQFFHYSGGPQHHHQLMTPQHQHSMFPGISPMMTGGGGGNSPYLLGRSPSANNSFVPNGHPGSGVKNIHLPNGYTYSPSPRPGPALPQQQLQQPLTWQTTGRPTPTSKPSNTLDKDGVQTYLV